MATVLVTGATGSVGSNVCRLAVEHGHTVRALVRDPGPAAPLAALGVDLVEGDVTDPASVDAAAAGVNWIIHGAAVLGGTWTTSTAADFEAVNQWGAFHVLDAAEREGVERTVLLLSGVVLDSGYTSTERGPFRPISDENSPYTKAKLAAMYEGLARAARGRWVNFVVPGGIYGPTPMIERALVPTIYTGTLLDAAHGKITSYIDHPQTWVLASDVAEISLRAASQGRRGAFYLALGPADQACSLARLCNKFLELAGIDRHVEEVTIDPTRPDAEAVYGSMLKYVQSSYPEPHHDDTATTTELGVPLTSVDDGLRQTLEWLRLNGKL
ncbi:MAG: NAD-dependent epimerase/dehydratase family protein [Acidimicrobiia bacterium]